MLSYARGPTRPLMEETVYTAFANTAARYPDADALIVPFQSVRLSFRALAAEIERVGGALLGLGLELGDRFGVWATCAMRRLLPLAAGCPH